MPLKALGAEATATSPAPCSARQSAVERGGRTPSAPWRGHTLDSICQDEEKLRFLWALPPLFHAYPFVSEGTGESLKDKVKTRLDETRPHHKSDSIPERQC